MNASSVIIDDYEGAYEAVEHLITQGCKQIVHLSGPDNLFIGRKRKEGYVSALEDHQITLDERYVVECRQGTKKRLNQPCKVY